MGRSVSFVTYGLVVIIAICTLTAWFSSAAFTSATQMHIVMPDFIVQFVALLQPVSAEGGPWPFISHMFLHASWPHFICNMISLLYIGVMVERLYGHARMLIGFFVSGICGGIAFRYAHAAYMDGASCVGASGAIFGLMAMYAAFLVMELVSKEPYFLNKKVAASLLASIVGVLAVNIFISFAPGIALEAHFGGLAGGLICSVPMLWQMRMRERAKRDMSRSSSPARYTRKERQ